MINLTTQDKYDGNGKVSELRGNIGEVYYTRNSKTGTARLVAVSNDGDTCRFIEVKSEFECESHIIPSMDVMEEASWYTWNCMCS
tara:strand:+ start:325 stop:579 length:255 start_codon:yes stop_codon:yes gene_type:complete